MELVNSNFWNKNWIFEKFTNWKYRNLFWIENSKRKYLKWNSLNPLIGSKYCKIQIASCKLGIQFNLSTLVKLLPCSFALPSAVCTFDICAEWVCFVVRVTIRLHIHCTLSSCLAIYSKYGIWVSQNCKYFFFVFVFVDDDQTYSTHSVRTTRKKGKVVKTNSFGIEFV